MTTAPSTVTGKGATASEGASAPQLTWKRLNPKELAAILQAHERFVTGVPGGRRALLAHHEIENEDFTNRNLTEIDFVGAKLSSSRFSKSIMARANLYAADL